MFSAPRAPDNHIGLDTIDRLRTPTMLPFDTLSNCERGGRDRDHRARVCGGLRAELTVSRCSLTKDALSR
jgi:hypothetical protein